MAPKTQTGTNNLFGILLYIDDDVVIKRTNALIYRVILNSYVTIQLRKKERKPKCLSSTSVIITKLLKLFIYILSYSLYTHSFKLKLFVLYKATDILKHHRNIIFSLRF